MIETMTPLTRRDVFTALALGSVVIIIYGLAFFFVVNILEGRGRPLIDFSSPPSDATVYRELGRGIAERHEFYSLEGPTPEFFRTPVYPAFLAAFFTVGGGIIAIVFGQIFLAGATTILIFFISRKFLPFWGSICLTVVSALSPPTIIAPMMTLTETLFTFLLTLLLFLLSFQRGLGRSIVVGMLLGLLILTRPIFFLMAPLFLLYMIFEGRGQAKNTLKHITIVTLVVCLVTVPWVARNMSLGGHARLSTISAYNTLFHNVVEFESFRRGVSKDDVVYEIRDALGNPEGWRLSTFEYFDAEKELVNRYIGSRIEEYILFHTLKSASFFLGSGLESSQRTLAESGIVRSAPHDVNLSSLILSRNIQKTVEAVRDTPLSLAEIFIRIILCISMGAFVLMQIYQRSQNAVFALLLCMLFVGFGLSAGPLSIPRYRIPVEPLFFVLSFSGIRGIFLLVRGKLKKMAGENVGTGS